MVVKIVDPMGTEFDSIVSLCSFWGVSVKDFYQGVSQGLSMDECLKYALDCVAPTGGTKVDKSKKRLSEGNIVVDHTGQEFPSVRAMCEHWGISADTFYYRHKVKKLSLEKSLTNTLKKREGVYDHLGQEFNTASEMCKHWGILFSTYKYRIDKGYSLEEALTQGYNEGRRVVDTEGGVDISKETLVKINENSNLKDENSVKTRSVVDHLGNSYPSVSAMCEAYGVKYPTYNNRRRRGWSVERSLTSKVAEVVDHKGNTYKSFGEMCDTYGTCFTSFCRRRKAGWSLEECLLGKGPVEDHEGRSFGSLTAMCKFYGVDPSSYKGRLKRGFSVEEALLGNILDFEGNRYFTVNEMCKHWGINCSSYNRRMNKGWSQQDALTIKPKSQPKVRTRKQKDHLGNVYPTFKAMCDAYGLPSYLVRARLDRFKFSLEAALTTPKNKKGSTFRDKAQRRDGVSFKKRGIFDSRPIMVDDKE